LTSFINERLGNFILGRSLVSNDQRIEFCEKFQRQVPLTIELSKVREVLDHIFFEGEAFLL
jgi:hypothetical protein